MHETRSHIENELLTARRKDMQETVVLEAVNRLLAGQQAARDLILGRISGNDNSGSNAFNFDLLESDKIFHLAQIRSICIDYRLRFLDSRFFKDGIPEEAISKINQLEKIHQTKLQGFKIMAPSKAFQLLSYDDPLLFAPIGNDYFYLVHKWGNDISPKRKWLMKPFKNLMNFTWFCVIVSLLITWMTPETNLSKSVPMANIIIFLFAFKSIIAVFLYAFFMLGKNFNAAIWDRKYFNN
jgi:hypothetical protein